MIVILFKFENMKLMYYKSLNVNLLLLFGGGCRQIGQEEGLKQDEGIRMEVGVWSIVWWQWK